MTYFLRCPGFFIIWVGELKSELSVLWLIQVCWCEVWLKIVLYFIEPKVRGVRCPISQSVRGYSPNNAPINQNFALFLSLPAYWEELSRITERIAFGKNKRTVVGRIFLEHGDWCAFIHGVFWPPPTEHIYKIMARYVEPTFATPATVFSEYSLWDWLVSIIIIAVSKNKRLP